MLRITNECCDCASPSYPCRGASCPNRNVTRYYCDRCGSESELYDYDGEELCQDCLLEEFPRIEGSY